MPSKLVSRHDELIKELLRDPNYMVLWSGEIMTRRDRAGHIQNEWRPCGTIHKHKVGSAYFEIKYKGKSLLAHRIVYQKYVGELDPTLQINHKDGDGLNNCVDNLELVTASENARHRFQVLGRAPVIGHSKINQKIAERIRKDHEKGLPYSALTAKYKLSKGTISMIINNKIWKVS